MPLPIGFRLGPYEILSILGAGGMGEVYLAHDTRLQRKVAIKVLRAEQAADDRAKRRLVREAQAAAALDHPNICAIHEVGETDGRSYIVMQYVEGQTLASFSRGATLDVNSRLAIAVSVAEALAEAHRHGIVHRDIKPQNVMLSPRGHVKVLDFGLARVSTPVAATIDANESLLTETGVIVGTVPYMSPEQIRGEALDTRSDIFSFGTLLYELVTGTRPFAAASAAETISAILTIDPPSLERDGPAPPDLQRIVRKCLEKDRTRRYQATDDLVIDLKNVRREIEVGSSADVTPKASVTRWVSARTVAALLVLALVSAIGVYWSSSANGPIRSLAVLPFVDGVIDAESEYQSDGITDNIIDRLSKLPNLRVTSHSAVFRYKGRDVDPQAVGRELGVEAILTGRVDRRRDGLTIRLELIDADDNSRLWGQRYEGTFSDLLSLQGKIPIDISEQLRVTLSGSARDRLARQDTKSVVAYELYLKGRYSWEQWSQDGSRRAVEYFERAIAEDPTYALAYSGLADAYMVGTGTGIPVREAHRRAREAATRALAIDPLLGEARASLSQILLFDDWDFAGAERELSRALELSPNYVEGHHMYSHFLLVVGRHGESLVECQKIVELDPLSPLGADHFGYHYLYTRQYDAAIKSMLTLLKMDGAAASSRVQLADAYYQNGMYREAVEQLVKARAMEGAEPSDVAALNEAFAAGGIKAFLRKHIDQLEGSQDPDASYALAGPMRIAMAYARLGDANRALAWLEKAYAAHSDALVHLREEVAFDTLRADPRFTDLLKRVGLPAL